MSVLLQTVEGEEKEMEIGYGWLEEQAKNGRPVKVSAHFFKEPIDYVKAIKPFLYSVQDDDQDLNNPYLYKFQLYSNNNISI